MLNLGLLKAMVDESRKQHELQVQKQKAGGWQLCARTGQRTLKPRFRNVLGCPTRIAGSHRAKNVEKGTCPPLAKL